VDNNNQTLTVIILSHHQAELVQKLIRHIQITAPTWSLLVVDDYSTDVDQLSSLSGTTFLQHHLNSDFAAQRNWSLTQVTTEWSWFIDADEWPSTELINEVKQLMSQPDIDAICLPRRDWFLGRLLQHGEVGQMRLLRIARTAIGQNGWHRPVHETWEVTTGRQCTASHYLEHSPHPSLAAFIAKLDAYASLEPLSRTKYSRPQLWWESMIFPPAKFLLNYVVRSGWRDGMPGLIHACLMSFYSLLVRLKLYESWYAQP
jgi:glycosyltransferase involved in cell wall biosynthesis